jgi:H+/gluconate symporter-like permease
VTPDPGLLAAAEVLRAHHAALVAIPAFVPAIVVVAVVLHIARKDRRDEAEERELIERAFAPEPDDDTPDDGEQGGRA